MRILIRLAALGVVGSLLAGCGTSDESGLAARSGAAGGAVTIGLKVGQQAPEITGADLGGRSRKLSDYRGKVVLLDFWAVQ